LHHKVKSHPDKVKLANLLTCLSCRGFWCSTCVDHFELLGKMSNVFCGPYELLSVVNEVAVGTIIADRPRTDPHERSLAHADPISDEWRRNDQEAKDASRELSVAIV
jgi:hypothetical protein